MSKQTENPFFAGEYDGHKTYVMSVDDRITRVRNFDRKQCLAALALPDLQKTVSREVERRLRQIDRGK